MGKVKFKDILRFGFRSKMQAGEGENQGKYPFYTSSQELNLFSSKALYDGPALIIGTGGAANIHYSDVPFSVSADCLVAQLRKGEEYQFNLKYIYYYFWCNIDVLQEGFKGVALQHISKEYLESLYIPVKPMSVQDKIVNTLDKIVNVIHRKESIIVDIQNLQKALFFESFGDPMVDSEKFEWVKLQNIIHKIETGISPVCESYPRESDDHYAVLKQSAITKQYFDPKQNKLLKDTGKVKEVALIKKNDLIISHKNTPNLTGTAVYIFEEHRNLLFHSTMYRICYKPTNVSGIYLCFLFNDANFRKELSKYTTGTMTSMINLAQDNLYLSHIPLPNIKLQKRFDEKIRDINEKTKELRPQLERLNLFLKIAADFLFNEEIPIDVESELLSLLKTIDSESENNDFLPFERTDFLKKLIEKITQEDNSFETKADYDKAKIVVFALLKKGKIKQIYDSTKKEMKIFLNEAYQI